MMKVEMPDMVPVIKDELKKILSKAAIKNEMVEIGDKFRGLGKTTALIEFAKENDLIVVVRYGYDYMRKFHKYDKIFGVYELKRGDSKLISSQVCVDEGVDLVDIIENGLRVVTGWRNASKSN